MEVKRCNICGNSIKSDDYICEQCGHDLRFEYKKNDSEYKKNFVHDGLDHFDRKALFVFCGAVLEFVIAIVIIWFIFN